MSKLTILTKIYIFLNYMFELLTLPSVYAADGKTPPWIEKVLLVL